MRYIKLFILLFVAYSCKPKLGNNVIYQDIVGQLMTTNDFMPFLAPPSPPPPKPEGIINKNEAKIIGELQEQVYYLNERLITVQRFLTTVHEIYILDYTLPVNPIYFKSFNTGTSSSIYDTTWIGNINNRIKSGFHKINIRSLKFSVPNYNTQFIDIIPNIDTSYFSIKKNTKTDRLYLQLSEIILDKSENKGIFYFAISTNGNLNGYMQFCYIQKIKGNWEIMENSPYN